MITALHYMLLLCYHLLFLLLGLQSYGARFGEEPLLNV